MSNTDKDWGRARTHLHDRMMDMAALGMPGRLRMEISMLPLKRRMDQGDRSEWLYDAIMKL